METMISTNECLTLADLGVATFQKVEDVLEARAYRAANILCSITNREITCRRNDAAYGILLYVAIEEYASKSTKPLRFTGLATMLPRIEALYGTQQAHTTRFFLEYACSRFPKHVQLEA